MRPRARVSLIWLILSLTASLAAGWLLQQRFEHYVATRDIVVAAVSIPPYTQISAEMLQTREMPRALAKEPIYLTVDQVAGRVSRVPMQPGQLLYRSMAVSPKQFRFVDDPTLEIISFPVDPDKAVGGQVQPFQRINLYRIAHTQAEMRADPVSLLTRPAAATELLARHALVVDVRTKRGGTLPTTAQVSATEKRAEQARAYQEALQIITVAVPPETAHKITRLMGELHASYELWVSLAPLGTPSPEEVIASPTPWPTPTAARSLTRTPRPTFTPRPTPSATLRAGFTPRPTATSRPEAPTVAQAAQEPTATAYPFDVAIPAERMQKGTAEGGTSIIRGTVINADGSPLTGHRVFLRYCCPEGRLVYPPKGSDLPMDGHFEFTVSPGSYWPAVEGLATQDREVYVPPEGATWTILAVRVP